MVNKATNVIVCKAEDLREPTSEDVDIAALVDCGPFSRKPHAAIRRSQITLAL